MDVHDGDDLAGLMASVARHLDEPVPVVEVLQRVLVSARDTIHGVRHAGIAIGRRAGKIETAAWTDPVVLELEALQYELSEGPCVDAVTGLGQCWVDDLAVDTRWPAYGPKAAALGVVSQHCHRLADGHRAGHGHRHGSLYAG